MVALCRFFRLPVVWLVICCVIIWLPQALSQQPTPTWQAGGNIRVSTVFYGVSGIENRRAPFGIIASGSPYVEVFGNRVPLQFTVSNFRSRFHQPFNQFGISPHYKWIKLHLGFRNLQFSQFTLGGARLLGGGVELTPGKFYFAGVYGKFRAARTFGSPDLAIIPGLYTVGAIYERSGYSFKIGVGQQRHYFHLILLKASDDAGSLTPQEGRRLPPVQENTIIGLNTGFQIVKNLQWRLETSMSAWTLDNESPLLSRVPSIVNPFFTPRVSSQYLFAGETSLSYRNKGYAVEAKYRRVDPDYKSMGMYFVQSDLEQFSGNISLPLGKGRWYINAGGGIQRDNLSRLKAVTSSRIIANVSATLRITDWLMLAAMYSNFGMSQSPVQATISDTLLLEQVHRNIMIAPNFQFRRGDFTHNIRLQFMEQGLSDLRASAFDLPTLNSRVFAVNYTLGIPQKRTNAGAGLQRMNSFLGVNNISNIGVNGSYNKRLKYKNINLNAQTGLYLNQLDNQNNGYTLTLQSGADYPVLKTMRLSLQAQWLKNSVIEEGPVRGFTEWTVRTTVNYQFSVRKKSL